MAKRDNPVSDNEVKLSNYPSIAEAMVECWDRAPNVTLFVDRYELLTPGMVIDSFPGLTIRGMGSSYWEDGAGFPSEQSGVIWTNPSSVPILTFKDCRALKIRDLVIDARAPAEGLVGISLQRCHAAVIRDVCMRSGGPTGIAFDLQGCIGGSMYDVDTRGWQEAVRMSYLTGRNNAWRIFGCRFYSSGIGVRVMDNGASSLSLFGCTVEASREYGALIEEENCNLFDFGSHWENKDAPSHVKLARGGVFGNSRFNAIA